MEKTIVQCKKCSKKMKIRYELNKYKCPSCGEIYVLTRLKFAKLKLKGIFVGIKETAMDVKNNIVYKVKSAKAAHNYTASVKKNMKKDPNWSNYHKEQKEYNDMKKANKKWSLKNVFRRGE